MIRIRTVVAVALMMTTIVVAAHVRAASDDLERAKELYRSASYDEAVDILDRIPAGANAAETVDVYAYRVFCLVALDRKDDAQKAIAALVNASPLYVMSELEASPRVRTMFTDVRRTLLPAIVQREYAAAKAAFDAKDPIAVTKFDGVLRLLQDPDVRDNAGLADLGVVATGFRDLSKMLVVAPPVAPPTPAAAPVAAAPPAPTIVVPVVLTQNVPPAQLREEREWTGEIEIVIDETGRVSSARMTAPIHPVYDQQLTKAALTWTYRPALRNGIPEQFVKRIPVHLDTRRECTDRSTGPCRERTPR